MVRVVKAGGHDVSVAVVLRVGLDGIVRVSIVEVERVAGDADFSAEVVAVGEVGGVGRGRGRLATVAVHGVHLVAGVALDGSTA